MSITDELRRVAAKTECANGRCEKLYRGDLERIADRIDAEHDADVSTACRLAAGLDNDALAKRGYIALPVDADGVPIHVGDRLDGYGKTIEVVELRHGRSGWVLISRDGNAYADTFAFSHHRVPTVEDVLDEFVARWMDTHHDDIPALKAEYAARLRLVGEGDACRE